MAFFKDIITKGIFETMVNKGLDKKIRIIVCIITCFLYLCIITLGLIVFLNFEPGGGKVAIGIIVSIIIFWFIFEYIRFFLYLNKMRKIKKINREQKRLKEEQIRKELEEKYNSSDNKDEIKYRT